METPRHRDSLCLCVSVAYSLRVLRRLCVDYSDELRGAVAADSRITGDLLYVLVVNWTTKR